MPSVRSTDQQAPQRQQSQRRRRKPRDHDAFYIDRTIIPRGQDWQWNRISVLGEPDRENQIDVREAAWEPVRYRDLPEHMRPIDLTEQGLNDPVVKRGQMLMRRPLEYTLEARAEDLDAARGQLRDKQKQLGQPTADATAPRSRPEVSSTFEAPEPRTRSGRSAPAQGQDVE